MDWTPVTDWLVQHGPKLIIILLVGFAAWFFLRRLLPPLLRRTMSRTMKGESREAIKKRTDTLTSVFIGAGSIIIFIFQNFFNL